MKTVLSRFFLAFYGKRKGEYRIIFMVRGDDVVVLYIHHGARKELEP